VESWLESANGHPEFPVQNLPFGVFRPRGGPPRCGVAIGDCVLDLAVLEEDGLVDAGGPRPVFAQASLNGFMALGPAAWARVRERLTDLMARCGAPDISSSAMARRRTLHDSADVELLMPVRIRGYTDFNAARQHAYNAGRILRGENDALPKNWLHLPIAYNGRASTVVVSGTPIRRPWGQRLRESGDLPEYAPSALLDFELELGALVGTATSLGSPVSVAEAEELIFGYVLLNDWSARDIQAWESRPLGPFQGKAFGTTISPWIVPSAALSQARVAAPPRDHELLSYLAETRPMHLDVCLKAEIVPAGSDAGAIVTQTNSRHLYYSIPQMIAHHTSGGCSLDVGDLIGTGTISGPEPQSWASLFELTHGGSVPLQIATEDRTFLEDGDSVRLRGHAQVGEYRIGFGSCDGRILPALGS